MKAAVTVPGWFQEMKGVELGSSRGGKLAVKYSAIAHICCDARKLLSLDSITGRKSAVPTGLPSPPVVDVVRVVMPAVNILVFVSSRALPIRSFVRSSVRPYVRLRPRLSCHVCERECVCIGNLSIGWLVACLLGCLLG